MRVIEGGKREGSEFDLGITVSRVDHLKLYGPDGKGMPIPEPVSSVDMVVCSGDCYQCGKPAGDSSVLFMCDVCENFYCPSCKARDHDKPGHEKLKPLINRSKFKVVDGNQV